MKILIIGTGVIGTLYGIALSEHNQIMHYVRKHKLNEWDNKTIKYDFLDERLPKKERNTIGTYTFHCTDSIKEEYDLIFVPVNSYQLFDTLNEINKYTPNAKYLIMTLNWRGTLEIDKILKPEQYVMGYAGGGGTYKDNNTLLWANMGNDILLGSVYDSQKKLLDDVNALFLECKIKPEIPNNILHALWLHNIASAPFGAALIKHKDLQKTFADKELGKACFRAFKECYKIVSARGVNLNEYPETKIFKLMFSLPLCIQSTILKKNLSGKAAERYTSHALLATDEMKSNFDEILKTARELNLSVPNMEKLNSLIS